MTKIGSRTFIKNAATALGVMLAVPLMVQATFASECAELRPEAKIAWEAALKLSDAGHARWATGDASAIKTLWANMDEVTIFGGLGAYERGWDQVGRDLIGPLPNPPPTSGNTNWQKELISVHICNDISIATQIEQFTARMEPAKEERRRFCPRHTGLAERAGWLEDCSPSWRCAPA